eukprot:COSAG02_NODE_55269_length_291_cov_1.067708_1_plen_70_part_00
MSSVAERNPDWFWLASDSHYAIGTFVIQLRFVTPAITFNRRVSQSALPGCTHAQLAGPRKATRVALEEL